MFAYLYNFQVGSLPCDLSSLMDLVSVVDFQFIQLLLVVMTSKLYVLDQNPKVFSICLEMFKFILQYFELFSVDVVHISCSVCS